MSTNVIVPEVETPVLEPTPVVEQPVVGVPETVPTVEPPVVAPVVEAVPEPELTYEYQPVDEQGRALGAKQVFKGKTHQELLDKVATAHKESIKLTRELKKNLRLGQIEQDEIPEDSIRVEAPVQFTPKTLTADERFRISQELTDPEKCDAAVEALLESTLGAKPEVIRENIRRNNEMLEQLQAKSEAEFFMRSNPEYYPCRENFETIVNWMIKNDLKPIRQNFQLAYNKLSAVGLLLEAPIVREDVQPTPVAPEPVQVAQTPANTQPEPEPVSRITDVEPQPQQKRPSNVPTGLNRSNTSDVGTPVQKTGTLTLADIEKMPSEEYKRRLNRDPKFREEVEALLTRK